MPKVRMKDTTSLGSGPLLAGEVYDLSDDDAKRLRDLDLAGVAQGDTETYAEKQARVAGAPEAAEDEGPPMNPEIARQVAAAGTKEGDQPVTTATPQRQPLNAPPAGSSSPRAPERGR